MGTCGFCEEEKSIDIQIDLNDSIAIELPDSGWERELVSGSSGATELEETMKEAGAKEGSDRGFQAS